MPYSIQETDDNLERLGEKSKDVIDLVQKEFAQSESVLQDWKRDIVSFYELYSLVQKNRNYEGMANIFVPEILRAVETVTAKLYGMIFSDEGWMEYCGRDNNGDDGPALALTQLVHYQMDENNFKARVMDSLRQMVITGLTVRKILWDFQEVNRQTGIDPQTGKPTRRLDTIKDTWTFEPVDLLTFHISDINIPYNDLQKAEWIGEEYRGKKEWVRLRAKRGWFSSKNLELLENDEKAPDSQAQQYQRQRFQAGGFIQPAEQKDNYLIWERWGLVPCEWVYSPEQMKEEGFEDGDRCEAVVVIANKKAILKIEKNPWYHQQKPYVACPYVPEEFELAGLGAAKIGKSMQEEINDTRNQVLDNKTLVLSTMWLKSRGSGIKDKDLVMRQNGVITTNDMEGLQALRPPIVAGVGTNMEGVAKDDLRESVGAASNLQGIAQAGVGTATEASTINRESIGRLLLTAQLYCELILKPTFVFAEFLNYQFYDHVKVIRVVGPSGAKYQQLKPEEIAGGHKDVIIKISLDSTENPAVHRQQFLNFFTLLQSIPPQLIPLYWKILDKAYGMFFNGHKLDEILPNPGPTDPDELLTPEEERDTVIAEQKVLAQKGQNHQEYIKYHQKEYMEMHLALNPKQNELYQALIKSHYDLLKQEMAEQMQQHMQMIAQVAANGAQENGAQGGGGINRGSTQNTTPFNQSAAPSTESLRKGIGG